MTENRGASETPDLDVETTREDEADRERRGSNTPNQRVERAVVSPPEKRGGGRA